MMVQSQSRLASLAQPRSYARPRTSQSLQKPQQQHKEEPERPRTALPSIEAAAPDASSLSALDAVLFLDVDGVLHVANPRYEHQRFRTAQMSLLREVVRRCGATIVLSTAWRLRREHRAFLAAKLDEYGLKFRSRTPSLDRFNRPREIGAWCEKWRPRTWVAVDDLPLGVQDPKRMDGHFVKTRPHLGLDRQAAARIVALFDAQKQ